MRPKPRTYTIHEAAERCGFSRPNTFREKFLDSPEARAAFGAEYDSKGRLVVDRNAVEELVTELEEERKRRGNWRVKNLGEHAVRGPHPRKPTGRSHIEE